MSEPDYEKMSLDEIEAALVQAVDNPAPQAEVTPEPEPVPEPTPEPSSEPETPSEPPPAEPEPAPEEDPAKLLYEEMQARAKHWEQVAGRNAGELGFIKKQLADMKAQLQRPSSDDADLAEPQPARRSEPPSRDSIAAWAVQQAAQQAAAQFAQGRPDIADLQPEMLKYMQESGFDAQGILLTDDPIQAARETQRVLEEAYWHVKATKTAARRAEIEVKRADQLKALAEAKKKAAVSAPASIPPPKPRAKTPAEMTDEELEKAMLEATGGRW